MASSLSFCSHMAVPDQFSFLDPNDQFSFLDPNDQFSSDTNYNILADYLFSPSDNLISLSPEIYPPHEFDNYQYPKRLKTSPSLALPEISTPPVQAPLFQTPSTMNFNCGSVKKTSLSAQSIAARERRKKIAGKTHELGKLVPGANKMNTAEMFQAAYSYIKFLQAQVQILESIHHQDVARETLPKLGILLRSETMQEKLYSEETCLVPKQFLDSLQAIDHGASQTSPSIFDEIGGFLQVDDTD